MDFKSSCILESFPKCFITKPLIHALTHALNLNSLLLRAESSLLCKTEHERACFNLGAR